MVEISKHLFDQCCTDISCHTIRHPWEQSCLKSMIANNKNTLIGSAKFYSIIYLIRKHLLRSNSRPLNRQEIYRWIYTVFQFSTKLAQIIMRGKKLLKKDEWKKLGEYYIRSTLFGGFVISNVISVGCLLGWLGGGKMRYYSYCFIPSFLNGVFIYLEPPSRRGLLINLFASLTLEYWLRNLERSGYIAVTKSKQTIMFMIGSALLFYLMRLEGDRKEKTPLFWLFTPEKVRRKPENYGNICPHDGSCLTYLIKSNIGGLHRLTTSVMSSNYFGNITVQLRNSLHCYSDLVYTSDPSSLLLRGTSTYLGIGLALSLAKVLLPRLTSPIKALSTLRLQDLRTGLFFGSYIGIYRAVICYLCRKKGYDCETHALPAGYLAGLSLMFNPSLGFATASLTGAFKLYSTILYEKKLLPENIPLPELLFSFCQATLCQARYMHSDVCPSYMFKALSACSNGLCDQAYANLIRTVSSSV